MWKSAWLQIGDLLAIPHCLSQISNSNTYSQSHGDPNGDGDRHFDAVRNLFDCDCPDVDDTDS